MSENTQQEMEQAAQEEIVQETPQTEMETEEAAPAKEEKKSFLKRGSKDKTKIEELDLPSPRRS